MGTRISCFSSGKIFSVVFLIENQDTILYCNVDRLLGLDAYKQLIIAFEWLLFFPR